MNFFKKPINSIIINTEILKIQEDYGLSRTEAMLHYKVTKHMKKKNNRAIAQYLAEYLTFCHKEKIKISPDILKYIKQNIVLLSDRSFVGYKNNKGEIKGFFVK